MPQVTKMKCFPGKYEIQNQKTNPQHGHWYNLQYKIAGMVLIEIENAFKMLSTQQTTPEWITSTYFLHS